MDVKQLTRSIKAIAANGEKRVEQIQTAAVETLRQCAEHSNPTYLNMLYMACRKGERDALGRWALAFGNVKPNTKKDTKATTPFVNDANKSADLEGAKATVWEAYQREATPVERLADEHKAIETLIGKLIAGKSFKDNDFARRAGEALRKAMDEVRGGVVAEEADHA